MVGWSAALLVRRSTEPPMPSPSMLAWRVLLICTDSTRSAGMMSSLTWRTVSAEAMLTPSTVVLVSLGSVPRTCTYLPSPSSRSRVTLGRRPSASATLALGRLVMTSAGRTWMMLSALSVRLMASTSPPSRPEKTVTASLPDATESGASRRATWPLATEMLEVKVLKPV